MVCGRMPVGWKICVRPSVPGASTWEYVVNADDVDAAIAAVRALDGMRDARVTVDQNGPDDGLSWLAMPVGTRPGVSVRHVLVIGPHA
jgi:hypothetical protein